MSGSTVIVWLFAALDLYFGARCFLNVIGVLQTSKYSQASTVIFAVLFLGLGLLSLYFLHGRHHPRIALLLALVPWVLAFVILFVTMVTSRYP